MCYLNIMLHIMIVILLNLSITVFDCAGMKLDGQGRV